jgi:hypothetical protein
MCVDNNIKQTSELNFSHKYFYSILINVKNRRRIIKEFE